MAAVVIGTTILATLTGVILSFVPKIPVFEFVVLRPPLIWFGESWIELKIDLHAEIKVQNENVFQSDVHAAIFDLYFPSWHDDFVHFGHIEDRFQRCANCATPVGGFWKVLPRKLFEVRDTLVMRIPLPNLWKIIKRLLHQAFRGGGIINVMSTGVLHLTAPPNSVKLTVTLICDTSLNLLTTRLSGNDCVIHEFNPATWKNLTLVASQMQDYAITSLQPDPVNGTVIVSGKAQLKQS
mmetsp:Transcript_2116/g.3122  ORF Transcript_2116/g.3122 Transcript_2116/m.3122 type:complete len:238 (-) Transcript_2116:85-798(-)